MYRASTADLGFIYFSILGPEIWVRVQRILKGGGGGTYDGLASHQGGFTPSRFMAKNAELGSEEPSGWTELKDWSGLYLLPYTTHT